MRSTTLGKIICLNLTLDSILAAPKGERDISKYRDTVLKLHHIEMKDKVPIGLYRKIYLNGGTYN